MSLLSENPNIELESLETPSDEEELPKIEITEVQNEGDKVRKENFTDALIKAFVVKRRKAMIDQEDIEEDNVDYETSVRRLGICICHYVSHVSLY